MNTTTQSNSYAFDYKWISSFSRETSIRAFELANKIQTYGYDIVFADLFGKYSITIVPNNTPNLVRKSFFRHTKSIKKDKLISHKKNPIYHTEGSSILEVLKESIVKVHCLLYKKINRFFYSNWIS